MLIDELCTSLCTKSNQWKYSTLTAAADGPRDAVRHAHCSYTDASVFNWGQSSVNCWQHFQQRSTCKTVTTVDGAAKRAPFAQLFREIFFYKTEHVLYCEIEFRKCTVQIKKSFPAKETFESEFRNKNFPCERGLKTLIDWLIDWLSDRLIYLLTASLVLWRTDRSID